MGTTLLGVRITDSRLAWVSVGDSSLYLYREGLIERLNQDHSMRPVIQQMVMTGMISESEAAYHPDRHALRSALCGDELSLIDIGEPPMILRKGDIIVLASDGIETLPRTVIQRIVGSSSLAAPAAIARRLVAACIKAGGNGQDNTTVAVITIRNE